MIVIDGDVFDTKIEKIIEISIDHTGIDHLRLGRVSFVFADRFVDVVAAQTGRMIVIGEEGLVITDFVFERTEVETWNFQ